MKRKRRLTELDNSAPTKKGIKKYIIMSHSNNPVPDLNGTPAEGHKRLSPELSDLRNEMRTDMTTLRSDMQKDMETLITPLKDSINMLLDTKKSWEICLKSAVILR